MKRLFWKNFFSLLLVFIAAAQWTCVAWLLRGLAGVTFPTWTHVAAPAFIYLFNRWLVSKPIPTAGVALGLRRAYTGFAFSCVFGLGFLLLCISAVSLLAGGLTLVGLGGEGSPAEWLGNSIDAVGSAVILAVAGAMAYGYVLGQRRVWINRLEVEIAGLAERMDGMRAVQISDIHLGHYMDAERISDYVERVNALEPDVVFITGDITDGLNHAHETFPALGRIAARLGVFVILGNHDVGTGAGDVIAALREHTGFTVLDDELCVLRDGDAELHLIGLMDRGMDWARGYPRCTVLEKLHSDLPLGAPAVLLSHRPDLFGHAASLEIPLTLAGHTHGGQVAIPLTRGRAATLARFMTRYPRGTYVQGRSHMHVNLGLGMTGQPVRVATPREITLITLRCPSDSSAGAAPATA